MTQADNSVIDPRDHQLQRGGRWERVLTYLVTGAYTEGEILRATDPGTHRRKVERARLHNALHNMRKVGLIVSVDQWGWTATPKGIARLEALPPLPAAPAAAPFARHPETGADAHVQ